MIEEILPKVNQIQINCWWIFDSARYIKKIIVAKMTIHNLQDALNEKQIWVSN